MCTCDRCKGMCRSPCLPSPDELKRLMDLGYGEFMMLNYHEMQDKAGHWYRVWIPCPANDGFEGKEAPWMPSLEKKGCVLQNKNGLCELHHVCKPIEAREATCTGSNDGLRERVARMWDNPQAQSLARIWKKKYSTDFHKED